MLFTYSLVILAGVVVLWFDFVCYTRAGFAIRSRWWTKLPGGGIAALALHNALVRGAVSDRGD